MKNKNSRYFEELKEILINFRGNRDVEEIYQVSHSILIFRFQEKFDQE